jgi:hypothetical protein
MLPQESTDYFESRFKKARISKPPEVNGLEEVKIFTEVKTRNEVEPLTTPTT